MSFSRNKNLNIRELLCECLVLRFQKWAVGNSYSTNLRAFKIYVTQSCTRVNRERCHARNMKAEFLNAVAPYKAHGFQDITPEEKLAFLASGGDATLFNGHVKD